MKNVVATLAMALTIVAGANASVLVSWDFSTLPGGASNYGPSPFAPATTDPNLTAGGLTRGSGISTSGGTGAANAWGGTGFLVSFLSLDASIAANEFVTFTVKANPGYALSFSSIDAYNIRRSSTGSSQGQWQYSLDNTSFVNIGSQIVWGANTTDAGNAKPSINLTGISALQNLADAVTVTFRLVTMGASNSVGTWYFNDPTDTTGADLGVSGTLTAVPEATAVALVIAGAGVMTIFSRRKRKPAKPQSVTTA